MNQVVLAVLLSFFGGCLLCFFFYLLCENTVLAVFLLFVVWEYSFGCFASMFCAWDSIAVFYSLCVNQATAVFFICVVTIKCWLFFYYFLCGDNQVLAVFLLLLCGENQVLAVFLLLLCGDNQVLAVFLLFVCGDNQVLAGTRDFPWSLLLHSSETRRPGILYFYYSILEVYY